MPKHDLTIVVPAAGEGSRFIKAGFSNPKPFIRLRGVPMVGLVIKNLAWPNAKYVLIARRSHVEADPEAVADTRRLGVEAIFLLDRLTEGTACTVLAAREHIAPDEPLLIANSDQLVRDGIVDMIADAKKRGLDGSIMVFQCDGDPKWSYARCDENGFVTEVAEKRVISNKATVGIYYFRKASYFFDAATSMIAANERVNNEFYTCPTYNYLIKRGGKVGIYEINVTSMSGLGTPEDLALFSSQEIDRYCPR